jgi:hypothetical protein
MSRVLLRAMAWRRTWTFGVLLTAAGLVLCAVWSVVALPGKFDSASDNGASAPAWVAWGGPVFLVCGVALTLSGSLRKRPSLS